MEISLRKAAKLRSKVEARLNEVRGALRAPYISFNPLDTSYEAQVKAVRDEWDRNFARSINLQSLVVALRNKIAAKNSDSYISVKITELAALKAQRAMLKTLIATPPAVSGESLQAQIDSAKKQMEQSGYANEITLYALTAEDIATLKKMERAAEKHAEKLHEEVESSNARLTIVLSDDEVAFLTSEDLL